MLAEWRFQLFNLASSEVGLWNTLVTMFLFSPHPLPHPLRRRSRVGNKIRCRGTIRAGKNFFKCHFLKRIFDRIWFVYMKNTLSQTTHSSASTPTTSRQTAQDGAPTPGVNEATYLKKQIEGLVTQVRMNNWMQNRFELAYHHNYFRWRKQQQQLSRKWRKWGSSSKKIRYSWAIGAWLSCHFFIIEKSDRNFHFGVQWRVPITLSLLPIPIRS